MAAFSSEQALALLRRGSGIPDASFRPGQLEAIRDVVAGARRLLVVQKTGWGKSFVYFIAVRLLRASGAGPALLISPLLALMRNQIAAAARMAWLAEQVPSLPGSGIIYTLTVRDAEQVAGWLRSRGLEVAAYSGDSGERRPMLEDALLANQVKALVATTALGMGYDKPDLAFVIHYQMPGSVVAYYQQVGRAGRALPAAYGVLLHGREDTEINDFFVTSAFPSEREVGMVLTALERAGRACSVPEIEGAVNLSRGRIQKTLDLLALESPAPVVKQGSRWELTAARLGPGLRQRAERLTRMRRDEQAQMQRYVALADGHMAFLIRALDGKPGHLEPPPLPPLPTTVSDTLEREAVTFLRRTSLPIEPRRPGSGLRRSRCRCPWVAVSRGTRQNRTPSRTENDGQQRAAGAQS